MRKWGGVGAGALSGVLVALAFPPAGLSPLVFVALVPLLAFVRAREGREVGWPFAVYGLVSFALGLSWLHTVIGPLGPPLLAALMTLLFVWPLGHLAGFLLRRGRSLLFVAPAVFLLSEWLRTWLFTGFPWLFLAHPLAGWTALIQVSDLLGAYAVTGLVVLANAAVAEVLVRRGERPARRLAPLVLPVACATLFLLYGVLRSGQVSLRPGPTVLLVQGNIPQAEKQGVWSGPDAAERVLARHLELTRSGLRAHPEAELVVWPETMFPYLVPDADLLVTGPVAERPVLERFREISRAAGDRPVIVGSLSRTGEDDMRNSAFLIGRGGVALARYDKMHAVPGGEYIPLRTIAPKALLRWVGNRIEKSAGFVPNLTEGDRIVLLPACGVRFAPLICFETCYPGIVRDVVDRGADVLLNLSNYGWFPGTDEPEQALQMTVFRAVETRRPVVVAANTGISGLVDPRGRMTPLVVDGKEKDVAGTFVGRVARSDAGSLYARIGDILPVGLAFAVLVLLGRAMMGGSRGHANRGPV